MDAHQKALAKAAHRHAQQIEQDLLRDYPRLWRELDDLRSAPPVTWPDWCLLPMGAPATIMTSTRFGDPTPPIAVAAALYAWRFARSVWIAEPGLTHRLLTQVPDPVSLGDLTGLPEWCVYLIAANPTDGDGAGDGADVETVAAPAGLWIHLEHDVNTGRPELRLLIDPGAGIGDMTALPVYLDRDTVTEALTDMAATARATLDDSGILPGLDVRAAAPTAEAATLADRVDAYLAIARYLCRPEADIAGEVRGLRPTKPRRPVSDRRIWRVGFTNR